MAKDIRNLGSFDDMIAQRAEAIGADGRTVTIDGFGKKWNISAPNLQSAEWNDQFTELTSDFADGYASSADLREGLGELLLADQKEAFFAEADKAGVDPLLLMNWAVTKMAEDVEANPTRRNSRSTPKRAKRR